MHRLVLHNLGPVKDCDINVNDFMVFTGPQASGKSTIAKAIYFFRTVKDEILDAFIYRATGRNCEETRLIVDRSLSIRFYHMFSVLALGADSFATYYYGDTSYITISLPSEKPTNGVAKKSKLLEIVFSDAILELFTQMDINSQEQDSVKRFIHENDNPINRLFDDKYRSVYIPAGRGWIAAFLEHLERFFEKLDEEGINKVDFCIQSFAKEISRIKTALGSNIVEMIVKNYNRYSEENLDMALRANKRTEEIIKGKYNNGKNNEGLLLNTNPSNPGYIELNLSSSGQLETVWITNMIQYYLVEGTPVNLIMEEPENSLYPNTQKKITELLSLFHNAGNQVLITTHSPYVLGTLNNLIYASDIAADGVVGVEKIIDRDIWLDRNSLSAWHMQDGEPKPATEPDMGLIRNEYIEGASEEINRESDKLYEIAAEEE